MRDEMPEDIKRQWKDWFDGLDELEEIKVPRCLHNHGQEVKRVGQELHVFSDASERAYAAAVYVVTETADRKRSAALALARARVARPRRDLLFPAWSSSLPSWAYVWLKKHAMRWEYRYVKSTSGVTPWTCSAS